MRATSTATGPASAIPSAAAGPAATTRPSRRRRTSWRTRAELAVLLGPALLLFVAFVLLPIVIAAYYSLYNWSGFGAPTDLVGLHNYRIALADPAFRQSIGHNLIIAGLSLVVQLPISIALALLLNRPIRGRTFLRLAVFAPYVLSEATTAVLWYELLQPGGFADQLLRAVGLHGLVHQWLADPSIVLYTLFVVVTWKYIGFGIILLLAGLQGVPPELREAAAIDGASAWQTTRRVVLPLLGPTIRVWIFLSIIGSLQLFDIVWIMTLGGPANASSTMVTYMIQNGFRSLEFGYGCAVAVLLFIISFIFALVYQRFALRRDTAGALTHAAG